ncbi:MAG: four helix bundle protein [Lentisphaerae bacterium]|nr:four helix bundle protein [Lentisphaerota bacterium]
MRDYRKIIAWQKADDLTVLVYEETKKFPKDEVYALTSQIRRAAYSVAANIVEGASRNSLTWIMHATSPARMRGVRGEAVWTYCEPRRTKQTGWNRRALGQHG